MYTSSLVGGKGVPIYLYVKYIAGILFFNMYYNIFRKNNITSIYKTPTVRGRTKCVQ